MDTIKFHRIDRLYNNHKAVINNIVERVYSDGQVLGGKAIEKLENEMVKRVKRKYAIAVGSGTDALSLALMGLGITFEDKVIVPEFTFPASYTCLYRLEAEPIFCPIEDKYYMIDHILYRELANVRSIKAVILVNLFGQMMDMERALSIAESHNLMVIEDACQSFTSFYNGKPAGSWGDVSCLSFDPTKILPAFSTGGMVFTDDKNTANNIRYYHYKNYGINSQLSTLQAEILLYWLNFLDLWEKRRIQIADMYREKLSEVKQIELPQTVPLSKHIWHKFVIKAEKRNELKAYLQKMGVETKIHYKPHKEVLSLPIYPDLRDDEVDKVIRCIKQFYL